jgi:hypothetical protein
MTGCGDLFEQEKGSDSWDGSPPVYSNDDVVWAGQPEDDFETLWFDVASCLQVNSFNYEPINIVVLKGWTFECGGEYRYACVFWDANGVGKTYVAEEYLLWDNGGSFSHELVHFFKRWDNSYHDEDEFLYAPAGCRLQVENFRLPD